MRRCINGKRSVHSSLPTLCAVSVLPYGMTCSMGTSVELAALLVLSKCSCILCMREVCVREVACVGCSRCLLGWGSSGRR